MEQSIIVIMMMWKVNGGVNFARCLLGEKNNENIYE